MANYRLVSNATFRPFSFEEYVKPYQMYGEAYREIESNIVDLEEKAGKWDKLANEQTDPKTHATYKAYADELRAEADQLSRYGMSPQLRRRAALMRGRYAKEIEPIEAQYNKREQLRQEQHQLQVASNGTLRFDNDYGNMSLDTMMDNPNMTYQFVSGEKIYQDVANMMLAAANNKDPELTIEDIEGGVTNKRGEAAFKQAKKRRGYTLEDVEKAINRDADADPYLLSIRQKVIDSYKNNSAFDETWADPYIAKGMRAGVLGVDSNMINNPNFSSDLQWATHDFNVWKGKQDVALAWDNNAIQREKLAIDKQQAYISMLGAQKQLSKQDVEMEAIGKKWDKQSKSYIDMTDAEKKRSSVYINTQDREGARKACSFSNNATGYVSIPANRQARKLQNGSSPAIKTYTAEEIKKILKQKGAGIFTYDEAGSVSGSGSLAPHAKKEVAYQLSRWGYVYKPEHFVYVVPAHKTGDAAEAILVPIDLLPDLYNKDSK